MLYNIIYNFYRISFKFFLLLFNIIIKNFIYKHYIYYIYIVYCISVCMYTGTRIYVRARTRKYIKRY